MFYFNSTFYLTFKPPLLYFLHCLEKYYLLFLFFNFYFILLLYKRQFKKRADKDGMHLKGVQIGAWPSLGQRARAAGARAGAGLHAESLWANHEGHWVRKGGKDGDLEGADSQLGSWIMKILSSAYNRNSATYQCLHTQNIIADNFSVDGCSWTFIGSEESWGDLRTRESQICSPKIIK